MKTSLIIIWASPFVVGLVVSLALANRARRQSEYAAETSGLSDGEIGGSR